MYVDGQPIGLTPTVALLARKGDGIIRIELDGYETLTVDRDKTLNGAFFGNCLFFGLDLGIAWIIDLVGSNQGRFPTEPIHAVMIPIRAAVVRTEDQTPRS